MEGGDGNLGENRLIFVLFKLKIDKKKGGVVKWSVKNYYSS